MRIIIVIIALLIPTSVSAASMCKIQQRLAELDYYRGEIDCQRGPRTARAIERFQRHHNLYPDGIADERTVAELLGADNTDERAEGNCKPSLIEEHGAARPTRSWAESAATKMWRRAARFKYGELFADYGNANGKNSVCTRSSVAGITNYRCVVTGYPCAAGSTR